MRTEPPATLPLRVEPKKLRMEALLRRNRLMMPPPSALHKRGDAVSFQRSYFPVNPTHPSAGLPLLPLDEEAAAPAASARCSC